MWVLRHVATAPDLRGSLNLETENVAVGNDKPREACGIFGAYIPGHEAARAAFFGIFALQHRGQESAGIAASNGTSLSLTAEVGLVSQVFEEKDLDDLQGHLAIAHTRYSTTGSNRRQNAQPIMAYGPRGAIAVGHNGNVINAMKLREFCREEYGSEFTGSTDSEVIAELFAKTPGDDWFEISDKVMSLLNGAYSLIMMSKHELIAVRDPLGVRPLCLGKLDGGWVFASESAALDNLGAEFVRELEPGEVMIVNLDGIKNWIWPKASSTHKMCIFEQIYFARPDSVLEGSLAYENRMQMGAIAYRENPVEADLVIGIPDSSTPHAAGFAAEANIPYAEGLVRNRYVGRTFIQPDQYMRDIGVKTKFNAMKQVIGGKRIVVVDDSIVRSTTIRHVVKMLRDAGAAEVHVRVAAPPIKSTCHFGVDMATLDQLIAANYTVEEICEMIDADTLCYLSLEGLEEAVSAGRNEYCRGCFTGKYPIDVQLEMDKLRMDRLVPEPVAAS
ncbi:MAG: amidophosphoribosyltransferase [Chloroflexi bacterium]|nr:amidophosphoribosyltransferase [Chloroflexota bacterium]